MVPVMQLSVHPDPESVAESAAGAIATAVTEAGDRRVGLGLAGGSTPRATYQSLPRTSSRVLHAG